MATAWAPPVSFSDTIPPPLVGELREGVHYVVLDDHLAVHLESAYDAFRAHAKRIDYGGEVVDLRALRRKVHENHCAGGYVVAESERVCFALGAVRPRVVLLDATRAPGA